jgi:hypothetical protein
MLPERAVFTHMRVENIRGAVL